MLMQPSTIVAVAYLGRFSTRTTLAPCLSSPKPYTLNPHLGRLPDPHNPDAMSQQPYTLNPRPYT